MYHLTTPHMKGSGIKHLQALLRQHKCLVPVPDGDYGVLTAQAVYRAKYWLGYVHPDHSAGADLIKYLEGKKKPSLVMKALAAKRRRGRKAVPMRMKALAYLKNHIGDREYPPESNKVQWASLWYGVIGPWCAMSVTRAYVEAGSKAFARGQRYAYVPYIVADARRGTNGLTVSHSPQPGDLVCYDWTHDGTADHVGLFERWTVPGMSFYAIEGNTAVGNDSNGGEVMRRERSVNLVQAFVHVGK